MTYVNYLKDNDGNDYHSDQEKCNLMEKKHGKILLELLRRKRIFLINIALIILTNI